jgi:hypothetical protein
LLWHYPPQKGAAESLGLSFPIQQLDGCPIPPGGKGSFSNFALPSGYFLIFVSWRGRDAMLVSHGYLYKTKTPKLVLRTVGQGIDGFLTL